MTDSSVVRLEKDGEIGVIIVNIALFRTRWGLRVRSVGEKPIASETVGVSVTRMRYGAVILGGFVAGLGGAAFTIGPGTNFTFGMTNGYGYIALAIPDQDTSALEAFVVEREITPLPIHRAVVNERDEGARDLLTHFPCVHRRLLQDRIRLKPVSASFVKQDAA